VEEPAASEAAETVGTEPPANKLSGCRQLKLRLILNPLPRGGPPSDQAPGIGAGAAATTRTALPVGLTLRAPGSANHGLSGHRVGIPRHRLPKKKLLLLRNVPHVRVEKIPRRFPRRAFAVVTETPDWLRGFRSWK
jgi:hypothetical protein